ncbi:hypothetical protein JTB14_015312 [Gonioctena quinquepunctata]|nr:hypothetical protein JTB14_015312 [Gonioctena quinquepunctata]
MGISGLLPFLEKATKPCNLAEFRGATMVVDTYCWLHKAANACTFQTNEDTQIYINYCMKYIKMLQSNNIKPILVFDGKNLPAKSETELKRRESRNKAKQRAAELLRLGKVEEAKSYLKQSVNITPEIASAVIKECHKINIDCIVAPYESDAQMAYFNIKGIAEFVITEDSDLMLFGCTKVIYKLDFRGCGFLVEAEKIHLATKIRPDSYTIDKFRYMCILSGCDYVDSLPGIGLKKAEKFFKLTEETNPEIFLDKVPRYLNMRHLQITEEYKEKFMIADATFRHQTVFDPFKRQLVPLTEPQVCGTNPKYCKNAGEIFSNDTAYQVALGNLHPTKHKELNSWSPTKAGVSTTSIWSGCYKRTVSLKQQLLSVKPKVEPKSEIKMEIVDNELLKAEEDKKIDEELQVYSKRSAEKRKCDIDKEESNTEPQHDENIETSPVFKKNPFIKKLSKFKSTSSIEKGVIVKSRFFSKPPEMLEEIKQEILDDHGSDINIKEQGMVHRKSYDLENITNNIESRVEEFANIKLNESNSITLDQTKNPSIEEKDPSYEGDTENMVICIEREQEPNFIEGTPKSEKMITVNKPKPSSSQKSPEGSNNQKRRKLGPCRSVGLKRSKSEGQPTLHNFFGKMNKN